MSARAGPRIRWGRLVAIARRRWPPGHPGGELVSAPGGRGCDQLDDGELVARFEARSLAPADYHHREHLRIAFAMLRGADLGEAAVRFRRAMRAYAQAIGAAGKYHETLTWAYLVLVHARMQGAAHTSSLGLLADHPELLDHRTGALARHYDVQAITASPFARRVFVLPER
jgi:hypothetical protein